MAPIGLPTIAVVVPRVDAQLVFIALIAVGAGLVLLGRGFGAYRRASLIAGTSTSTVASLAVGEVRVSGLVEAAEVALISPLQSARCVYYRSSIHEFESNDSRTVLDEERSVGFRVRDRTGSVRVFPRAAHFDVPPCLSESSGALGDTPAALNLRTGSSLAVGEPDRAAQVAALLTVHAPAASADTARSFTLGGLGAVGLLAGTGPRSMQYREARIEPGQQVTVIGRALPFDQLDDPDGADESGLDPVGISDPEITADLAAARAAGTLAPDAATAWGNAAIAGFGIGRPVSHPNLESGARRPKLATAAAAEKVRRVFEIRPEELVLAAGAEAPLTIALGAPGEATARAQIDFLLGMLGAILAIGGAIAFALLLQGGFR
jgi:hypothetical protein